MSGTNLTSNINMLSPTGFKLTINREKFANTEFFITSFTIPDISISPVESKYRNTISYEAGDTPAFGDLSLRFAIDEDMKNYIEIFNWLKANTTNDSKNNGQIERHDMILSVMTNKNSVNKQFQFKDAFPTGLSGVEFTTTSTEVGYLQADIGFRYNEFAIIK
tara:strand:- start:57 stop:545 length:489 start_codon:yes stop_codon:yes gene_type:complete